jgi:hypothetical protein
MGVSSFKLDLFTAGKTDLTVVLVGDSMSPRIWQEMVRK